MQKEKNKNNFTRRDFIRTSAAAAAGLTFCSPSLELSGNGIEKKSKKPHIIFIMTDQHRADALGCAGNSSILTPNIDSIAYGGVRFKNGFTAVPSCTPARAGLLTGLSPWNHGMLGYGRVADKYKYEMPEMLKNAGYYTFGIGKMHFYPQKALHGFHGTLVDSSGRVETEGYVSDYRKWFKEKAPELNPDATGIGWNEHRAGIYVNPEELHPTYWNGQAAVDFINKYDMEKPLFLKVSFARPHSPYDPPKRYLDMYKDGKIPEPVVGDWAKEFADFPKTKNAAFGDFGKEHAINSRRHYYANITFIDDQVGKIIDALKRKGMYENSLITFTADHGDMLGDHFHWRKTYAYRGSANIPYLMKLPVWMDSVVKRGSQLDYPVELRDFLPTFLDVCGENVPAGMDGKSLLKLIREKNPEWREYIDLEHATCYRKENYWAALTDGKIKYIFCFYTGSEQLFNLKNDPDELHDLVSDRKYSNILKLWRERMVNHLLERGEGFVRNGKLQVRKETLLYSPNYPKG
ncbi:arylsulfatase [candidate division KSB1 bacterium]